MSNGSVKCEVNLAIGCESLNVRGKCVEEVHNYKLLVGEWISRLLLAPSE
jgi:hypothetical protein